MDEKQFRVLVALLSANYYASLSADPTATVLQSGSDRQRAQAMFQAAAELLKAP